MLFTDRAAAGTKLADRLADLALHAPLVLALPRGGVPVAFQVAQRLHAPLDVLVVRKLGTPDHPELAMGAVGEDGVAVANAGVLQSSGVTRAVFLAVQRAEEAVLRRRVDELRGGRPRLALAGRTVVLVDDGVATGASARAACQVARAAGVGRLVLAFPVGAPDTLEALACLADEVVCLHAPEPFYAVGQWYRDFRAVEDAEVKRLLHG